MQERITDTSHREGQSYANHGIPPEGISQFGIPQFENSKPHRTGLSLKPSFSVPIGRRLRNPTPHDSRHKVRAVEVEIAVACGHSLAVFY